MAGYDHDDATLNTANIVAQPVRGINMGVMRFLVHPLEMIDEWPEVYRAYISGADGRVFPTRVELEGNVVSCRRNHADSGKMHIVWPIPGCGRPVSCTTALAEREEPYLLSVELARGKIAQLRDQLGQWELDGLSPPDSFRELYDQAHHLFAEATSNQEDVARSTAAADKALRLAYQAGEQLARAYATRRLELWRRSSSGLPALIGCRLGRDDPKRDLNGRFREAFTAAAVGIEWRDIEPVEGEYSWDLCDDQVRWGLENRLLLFGGPLLDLAPQGLPAWLRQWEGDFFNLQSFVCDFVETAISRYVGKIRQWEVCTRGNTGGGLSLSEENCLTLVARCLEVARQADDEVQLIVRVDQPWGEYQSRGVHYLAPLQFIDALLRSRVGLAAVNLEIAVGFGPAGSAYRDVLDLSRLIDLWSALGLPLYVTLAYPSAAGPDPASTTPTVIDAAARQQPDGERAQAAWVDSYLPLLMSKDAVVGVFWCHFGDRADHAYPHAGLVRPDGSPKPALEQIIQFRRTHEHPSHPDPGSPDTA